MGAIYCEPCIAARLHGAQANVPVAAPVAAGLPSPALAGCLGIIPGVGAWYNGQFVKGFIHVLVFALLIVGVNTVPDGGALQILLGLLIGFSPIYMAFEAHSTAKARMMGQPAPDPLGLERLFGFHEGQAATAAPQAPAQAAVVGSTVPPPPPAVQRSNEPVGAIILIALGVIFLLGNLGWFHAGRLWPLILIGVGLWIAYRRTTLR